MEKSEDTEKPDPSKNVDTNAVEGLRLQLDVANKKLREVEKKYERTERLYQKSLKYSEELRQQVEKLNEELHKLKKPKVVCHEVGIQVELLQHHNDQRNLYKESGNQHNAQNIEAYEIQQKVNEEQPMSIAESLKEAAEQGLQNTGYVYDERTGLYYDHSSGYYYDQENSLYFDINSGTYFYFNNDTQTYEFHSQVNVEEYRAALAARHANVTRASQASQGNTKDYKIPKKKKKHKNEEEVNEKEENKKRKKVKDKIDIFADEEMMQTNDKNDKMEEKIDENDIVSKGVEIEEKAPDEVELEESDLEEGELSESSESEESILSDTPVIDDIAHTWTPCIRAMVKASNCLPVGSLHIITCDGGTIGREKDIGLSVILNDPLVSKMHAEITYEDSLKRYVIVDFASQNGTFLDEDRLSEPKVKSQPRPLYHLNNLKIGETVLELHIHPGKETCDQCEPGVVQSLIKQSENKGSVIISKAEKERKRRQEMKMIKKRFGLEGMAYTDNAAAVKNPNYEDKAETRRLTVGSDNPYLLDDAPASVDRSISTENKGHKMLKKLGWKEGEGLGKTTDGMVEPVQASLRANAAAGFGSELSSHLSLDNVNEKKNKEKWLKAKQRYDKVSGVVPQKPSKNEKSWVSGGTLLDPQNDDNG